MSKTNEIIKYEQKQRLLDKMNRVTGAVSEFSSRLSYDTDAIEMISELYKMTLGYLCDTIIELDELDNEKETKKSKRKDK